MDERRVTSRDDFDAELALAAPEDRFDPPRPCRVHRRIDGEVWEGALHARRWDESRGGWLGLVTYLREYAPGFWHSGARWTPAHSIELTDTDQEGRHSSR